VQGLYTVATERKKQCIRLEMLTLFNYVIFYLNFAYCYVNISMRQLFTENYSFECASFATKGVGLLMIALEIRILACYILSFSSTKKTAE
jgi:hypothetical protein